MVLDSGATCSVIKSDVIKELGLEHIIRKSDSILSVADSNPLKVMGKILLPIIIDFYNNRFLCIKKVTSSEEHRYTVWPKARYGYSISPSEPSWKSQDVGAQENSLATNGVKHYN